MPQTPDLTKYLDAGTEFVSVTRGQARDRAQELVAQGQLAQNQVQSFIDGLLEGSRRGADFLTAVVRQEIQRQVQSVGIATTDDLARLEAKLAKQAKASKSAPKASGDSAPKASAKASAKKSPKSSAKKPAKRSDDASVIAAESDVAAAS